MKGHGLGGAEGHGLGEARGPGLAGLKGTGWAEGPGLVGLVAGEGGLAWAVFQEAAHAGPLVLGAEQRGELHPLDL